jgi:hypothetical protein
LVALSRASLGEVYVSAAAKGHRFQFGEARAIEGKVFGQGSSGGLQSGA